MSKTSELAASTQSAALRAHMKNTCRNVKNSLSSSDERHVYRSAALLLLIHHLIQWILNNPLCPGGLERRDQFAHNVFVNNRLHCDPSLKAQV